MKLDEALSYVYAPQGQTTVIASLLSGNMDPVSHAERVDESKEEAKSKLENAKTKRDNCQSDWAYWGYQGEVSYWSAVVDILEAFSLVDEIDGVNPPDTAGKVVMDAQAEIEDFGRRVLAAAKQSSP